MRSVTTPSAGHGVGHLDRSHVRLIGCKMAQTLGKISSFFKKKTKKNRLHIYEQYNSAITLLAIYPKEMKTHIHTKAWTWLFVAGFFIFVIVKNQNVRYVL